MFLFSASSVDAWYLGDTTSAVVECDEGVCDTGFYVMECTEDPGKLNTISSEIFIRENGFFGRSDVDKELTGHVPLLNGIYCVSASKGVWTDWKLRVEVENITYDNASVRSIEHLFNTAVVNSERTERNRKFIMRMFDMRFYIAAVLSLFALLGVAGVIQNHRHEKIMLRNTLIVCVLVLMLIILVLVTGEVCMVVGGCETDTLL